MLTIRKYPDDILSVKCVPIPKEVILQIMANYIREMRELMNLAKGIGLSAPQVGLPYRFFITNLPAIPIAFNPIIVGSSREASEEMEGCLSLPGQQVLIKRPDRIRLRYQDWNGNPHDKLFVGITARVIQHECDHLDGLLINRFITTTSTTTTRAS